MQSIGGNESNEPDPLIDALNCLKSSTPVESQSEKMPIITDVLKNHESDVPTEEHEPGIVI